VFTFVLRGYRPGYRDAGIYRIHGYTGYMNNRIHGYMDNGIHG